MSVTIDLAPEVEASLRQEADLRGLAPTEYASQLIQRQLPVRVAEQAVLDLNTSTEERIRLFHELVDSFRGLPALPPEAKERESFYTDRW